jgi:hypothetical protein
VRRQRKNLFGLRIGQVVTYTNITLGISLEAKVKWADRHDVILALRCEQRKWIGDVAFGRDCPDHTRIGNEVLYT